MFRRSDYQILSRKVIIVRIAIVNILVLIVGYLFLTIIIEPLFPISKDNESMKLLAEILSVLSVLTVIILIIFFNSYYISKFYQTKYSNKQNHEMFHSTEVTYLQSIRNKIVVGLENIKEESYSSEFLLDTYPSTMMSQHSMLDLFPSEIRNEIET